MSETKAPPIGHNMPPQPTIAEMLAPAAIEAMIAAVLDREPDDGIGTKSKSIRARAIELVDVCKRFASAHPEIASDEQDAKATEVLAVVQRFTSATGRVEVARIQLKAPILAADQAIGSLKKGPFARIVESVDTAAAVVRRASIAYKQRRETEIREAAQAEATRKAEEAALAERLADSGSGLVTMEDAANAFAQAEAAQQVADSKPAELTRSHGDGAGVSSLRYKRVVTILSPADVPRIYCVPDPAALQRAAGAARGPIPTIAGCKIEDVPDLTVRR